MKTPLAVAIAALVAFAASEGRAPAISPHQRSKLLAWYEALGAPSPGEGFGHYLARAARVQQGVAYANDPEPPGPEALRVELDRFECVSFIESSLAVARCGFRDEASVACFERELERSRYRGGRIDGYGSRLHYFVDWIDDNEARGRLTNLTSSLGGVPVRRDFYYITRRVLDRARLPEAELASLRREVERDEKRLSSQSHPVLARERAAPVLEGLEDGDILAFVYDRPGLLVHHAGFVLRVDGKPRLLHASSFHVRVVVTASDVSSYVLRRPERRGVIVARPLAP